MTKALGSTFGDEVIAAGLGGLPISWGPTSEDIISDQLTVDEAATLAAVVAAHNPDAPLPESVMSQDLMAQFTAADAAAIQAAIGSSVQLWLLWSSLQAQRDPMLVTNGRFLAGWGALVQVLGQKRMDEIAAALNVTVG